MHLIGDNQNNKLVRSEINSIRAFPQRSRSASPSIVGIKDDAETWCNSNSIKIRSRFSACNCTLPPTLCRPHQSNPSTSAAPTD